MDNSLIIRDGEVSVTKPFFVEFFDEDDGWCVKEVKPGSYKYRVLNVRGWKPRQLFIDGEWFDVMDKCADLEAVLSDVTETTTVANIAPTVDYLGHVMPVAYASQSYPSEFDGDDAAEKKKNAEKIDNSVPADWVSPLGKLIAGESAKVVLRDAFGLTEAKEEKDPALLKNYDAFLKINSVADIMKYPGKLVVKAAYPANNTFGMRIEDPELTEYFGEISRDNFSTPYIVVDVVFYPDALNFEDRLDDLDKEFFIYKKKGTDNFRGTLYALKSDPAIKDVYVHQK